MPAQAQREKAQWKLGVGGGPPIITLQRKSTSCWNSALGDAGSSFGTTTAAPDEPRPAGAASQFHSRSRALERESESRVARALRCAGAHRAGRRDLDARRRAPLVDFFHAM